MRIDRWLVLAAVASLFATGIPDLASASPSRQPVVTLVDNLGEAGTDSRFAEEGRNGLVVAYDQTVGLRFEVTRPTVLTEVGGFVQNLSSFAPGATVIVEIHPAHPDGRPNRTTVVVSSPLSAQTDPHFITYQRANFRALLPPGTYYAQFALADQSPHGEDAIVLTDGLRETAPGTFVPYTAPFAAGGVTHPPPYDPSIQELQIPLNLAERVLGESVLPTSKDRCRNGGWKSFGVFKNQGDCVSFVATKGKNQPSGH